MSDQPTNQEILEAVNSFSSDVDNQFKEMRSDVDNQFREMRSEINSIKSQMVTKDYLDDKLYDLKGDMVAMTRKEDKKLGVLVEILQKKQVINQSEAKQILEMQPFPQI